MVSLEKLPGRGKCPEADERQRSKKCCHSITSFRAAASIRTLRAASPNSLSAKPLSLQLLSERCISVVTPAVAVFQYDQALAVRRARERELRRSPLQWQTRRSECPRPWLLAALRRSSLPWSWWPPGPGSPGRPPHQSRRRWTRLLRRRPAPYRPPR